MILQLEPYFSASNTDLMTSFMKNIRISQEKVPLKNHFPIFQRCVIEKSTAVSAISRKITVPARHGSFGHFQQDNRIQALHLHPDLCGLAKKEQRIQGRRVQHEENLDEADMGRIRAWDCNRCA